MSLENSESILKIDLSIGAYCTLRKSKNYRNKKNLRGLREGVKEWPCASLSAERRNLLGKYGRGADSAETNRGYRGGNGPEGSWAGRIECLIGHLSC